MFRSLQRLNTQVIQATCRQPLARLIHTRLPTCHVQLLQRLQPMTKPLVSVHTFHSYSRLSNQQATETEEQAQKKHQMLIGFTCKVCDERSHHVMSKQAYTQGVVLIQCPGCKNRHLIADNLGWFRDSKTTVEDLVKEKGEAIRKVVVDENGVEKLGDLMEWLPEIVEEEKVKKEQSKAKAIETSKEEN